MTNQEKNLKITSKINANTAKVNAHRYQQEVRAEEKAAAPDHGLWTRPLKDPKSQAQFYGNLNNKLLQGIDRKTIEKMTVRDRVAAARVCYDMRQLELDRPTSHISFDMRLGVAQALPALQAELERRAKERKTIQINPEDISTD